LMGEGWVGVTCRRQRVALPTLSLPRKGGGNENAARASVE